MATWEVLADEAVDSAGSSANMGTWAGIVQDDAGTWALLTETSDGLHTVTVCESEDDARDRMAIAAIDGEPGPDDVDEGDLDAIDVAYRACALWSTSGDDGEPLDTAYDTDDLPDTSDVIRAFMVDCALLLDRAYARGYTPEQAGHDLWLTREHHGAGFWDRGLGIIGDALTDYAHALGSGELYEADGSLYFG